MNFIEVRSPLKPVGPARHETQHINTSWQDKGVRVDYVRSSANEGCEWFVHATLFMAPNLMVALGNRRDEEQVSTASSNNRQP